MNKRNLETASFNKNSNHHILNPSRINYATITNPSFEPSKPIKLPDSKRIFEPFFQENQKDTIYKPIDTWINFISKTSKEDTICGTNQRINNSNTYKSQVFTRYNEPDYRKNIKRISKPTENTQHSTKSQIVSLPGAVKRDTFDIKDDQRYFNRQNIGHLYKMQNEYTCHIFQDEIAKDDININNKEYTPGRYSALLKRKNNSQILGNEDNIRGDNRRKGKRTFFDSKRSQSQIKFG